MAKRYRFVSIGCLSALALVGSAFAAPVAAQAPAGAIYVSVSGSDTSGSGSASAPYQTIAKAVAAAPSGGTVLLASGTYKTTVAITRAVNLQSTSGAAPVIIDATGQQHGIVVSGDGASGTVISGVTIENADDIAVLVQDAANVTLENLVVSSNAVSTSVGAGEHKAVVLAGARDSTVKDSTVQGNKHGGIAVTDSAAHAATGNQITGNTVTGNTGDCGIVVAAYVPGKGVSGNTVSGNTVSHNVAGIVVAADPPGTSATGNVVSGNTVTGNFIPGVIIHSNAPGQTVSGNRVTGNTLSGNGPDKEVGLSQPTAIVIAAEVPPFPVKGTVVSGNKITGEYYGIAQKNTQGSTVQGNSTDASVTVASFTIPTAPLPKAGADPIAGGAGLALLAAALALVLARRPARVR